MSAGKEWMLESGYDWLWVSQPFRLFFESFFFMAKRTRHKVVVIFSVMPFDNANTDDMVGLSFCHRIQAFVGGSDVFTA